MFEQHRVRERQDVARTFGERLQNQRENIEAIEQVFAEAARLDITLQIAIRGGEQTEIGFLRARRTERNELALLQYAQQFGLHGEWQLAHFVEKQRAAVGLREEPFETLHGARERTAFVTEQQIFHHRLGQAGAVEGDESSAAAQRILVDEAGEHFLAGARGAADQDGHLRTGDPRGEHEHLFGERVTEHHLVHRGLLAYRHSLLRSVHVRSTHQSFECIDQSKGHATTGKGLPIINLG